ncbi:MAG: helix-turn-helix transcriptional regulator [bacterium]|nr:helix-turn-helix transcriptional regulator [bacterium]
MDVYEIGKRIREIRRARGYTLEEIARNIGVAKSTIQRYENGLIANPKLPVLQAIAWSLNVDLRFLLCKQPYSIADDLKYFDTKIKENRNYYNCIHDYFGFRCFGESDGNVEIILDSNHNLTYCINIRDYLEFCHLLRERMDYEFKVLLSRAKTVKTDTKIMDIFDAINTICKEE